MSVLLETISYLGSTISPYPLLSFTLVSIRKHLKKNQTFKIKLSSHTKLICYANLKVMKKIASKFYVI